MLLDAPLWLDILGGLGGWYCLIGAIYIPIVGYYLKKLGIVIPEDIPGPHRIQAIKLGLTWPKVAYYWFNNRDIKHAILQHARETIL